jgi:hypothetical protein
MVGGSNGGAFTLQAGRNINLNSSIRTANGNFTAIAGDSNAIAADREPNVGITFRRRFVTLPPSLTLGSGATINAGTGKVILAAIGGNFVNNTGSTTPITAAQWLVYSTDPRQNSRNGMVADYKHYAQPYTGNTPNYATTGNWFLYSVTPTLTVTPNSQTIAFGTTPNNFIPNFTGFIDGDTSSTAGINGSAVFGIDNFTGKQGSYNVAYLSGLASTLGYVFADNTASINELTVEPPPINPTVIPPVNPSVNPPVTPPVIPPVNPSVNPTVIPAVNPTVNSPIIQVNLINFDSQITPLQVSTTFNHWYQERHAHHDDSVDVDFGQYKGDSYQLKTVDYESRKEQGKRQWYEKKPYKLKNLYETLLFLIENNGIKLPDGLKPSLSSDESVQ